LEIRTLGGFMNKALLIVILLFCLFNISASEQSGKNGWTLKKKEDRYQIYQKKTPGSDFKDAKTIALITGSIDESFKVVTDPANFTALFNPHVERSAVLKKKEKCNEIYILINPPLFSRRETTVEVCYADIAERSFKLNWKNSDTNNSAKSEYVRMNTFSGTCGFSRTEANDELKVECITSLDLGGSIPIFTINDINSRAVVQFIWKIYHEILNQRKNKGGQK